MKERFINTIDHIGIFTNNYKRLVDFYMKKLGFEKEKEKLLSKSLMKPIFGIALDCKFVRLTSGSVKLEIFSSTTPTIKRRFNHVVGYNHWALSITNRGRFFQKLKRKKVNILEVKRNDHSVYFITDPDGNKIEIKE